MENRFTPKSVALVGASATPGKIGNSVLDDLAKHDYKGKVYPINPKQKTHPRNKVLSVNICCPNQSRFGNSMCGSFNNRTDYERVRNDLEFTTWS